RRQLRVFPVIGKHRKHGLGRRLYLASKSKAGHDGEGYREGRVPLPAACAFSSSPTSTDRPRPTEKVEPGGAPGPPSPPTPTATAADRPPRPSRPRQESSGGRGRKERSAGPRR